MSAPLNDRPVPIQDAFKSVTNATRFAASIVAVLVGYGVVAGIQGDALVALLGAIPGAVGLVGDVVRSFQVSDAIKQAEAKVTPVEDPAFQVYPGGPLVPLVPAE